MLYLKKEYFGNTAPEITMKTKNLTQIEISDW